jgi:O-acetyl-ADP-ribose deacetylase (regulator of RNase III)
MLSLQLTEKIDAKVGDITQEAVCAIVNAANSSLLGGGGVDGAIHRAGGSMILNACRELRSSRYPDGLPTGEAVATTAGELPADYVIHTVGPIYASCAQACSELLKNCYVNTLKEAIKVGCKSIAFPAISTGIYGYPKREAAVIAFTSVNEMLKEQSLLRTR